jgi:hypothetical protein
MTLFPASDKAKGVGPPELGAVAHATPALNTVIVSECIADIFYPATDGNILDRSRIRRLGNQQFRNVAPQFHHFFRITIDDHAFLDIESARGRNG